MAAGKKMYNVPISNAFAGLNSDGESDIDMIKEVIKTNENTQKPVVPTKPELPKITPKTNQVQNNEPSRTYNNNHQGPTHSQDGSRGASPRGRGGMSMRGRGGRREFNTRTNDQGKMGSQYPEDAYVPPRGEPRRGRGQKPLERPAARRDQKKGGAGRHNWGLDEGGPKNAEEQVGTPQSADTPTETAAEATAEVEGAETPEPAQEEPVEEVKKEDDSIGYDEYLLQQQTKRTNMPNFVKKNEKDAHIPTESELQAQGYEKYVKYVSDEEEDSDSDNEEESKQKKKAVNVFEYMHNEGCRVTLFPGYRGRGKSRGAVTAGGSRRMKPEQRKKDAPNLEDSWAFPSL